jgi:hypothetical protein
MTMKGSLCSKALSTARGIRIEGRLSKLYGLRVASPPNDGSRTFLHNRLNLLLIRNNFRGINSEKHHPAYRFTR